jgi:DNA-binding beta-propeller fold protein YncE
MGLLAIGAAVLLPAPVGAQAVRGSYIYTLSSFTGSVRQDFSRVTVDRERNEVYVLYQNVVRVFNPSGMEVYQFGDDLELGHIVDVAVDERGDILLLSYRDSKPAIVRCDYRGRPQAEVALKGLPGAFADFAPNRMVYRREEIALASTMGLTIVIADRNGSFKKGYDLFTLFELEEKDRGNVELGGFSVDGDGNVLMTAPVLFRAFVLSPDGKLDAFGKPSSAPGGFNIVAGIARDSKGNFLVVDRLKGSVLVFNRKFAFVTQFASRGYKPGELAFPDDLAIDPQDRVYVTQVGRRGVSVFKLTYL